MPRIVHRLLRNGYYTLRYNKQYCTTVGLTLGGMIYLRPSSEAIMAVLLFLYLIFVAPCDVTESRVRAFFADPAKLLDYARQQSERYRRLPAADPQHHLDR